MESKPESQDRNDGAQQGDDHEGHRVGPHRSHPTASLMAARSDSTLTGFLNPLLAPNILATSLWSSAPSFPLIVKMTAAGSMARISRTAWMRFFHRRTELAI